MLTTPTVTIYAATKDDVIDLVYMADRINLETHYHEHVESNIPKLLESMVALVERPESFVLIGRHEGRAIGMIGAIAYHSHISGELGVGELFWWAAPDFREGFGFEAPGLLMLRALERWAKEIGAKWLQLVAPSETVEAGYQALGYSKIEASYQKQF